MVALSAQPQSANAAVAAPRLGGMAARVGFGLAHVGGAGAHALADDELAAVGIDDGLGVVALGVALALAFAHESRVGVAEVDLFVGLGGVARGLGLGAFGGAFPRGARARSSTSTKAAAPASKWLRREVQIVSARPLPAPAFPLLLLGG